MYITSILQKDIYIKLNKRFPLQSNIISQNIFHRDNLTLLKKFYAVAMMSKKISKTAIVRQAIVEINLVVAGALAYRTVLVVVICIIFRK